VTNKLSERAGNVLRMAARKSPFTLRGGALDISAQKLTRDGLLSYHPNVWQPETSYYQITDAGRAKVAEMDGAP